MIDYAIIERLILALQYKDSEDCVRVKAEDLAQLIESHENLKGDFRGEDEHGRDQPDSR